MILIIINITDYTTTRSSPSVSPLPKPITFIAMYVLTSVWFSFAILTLWYKAVSFYFIAGDSGKPGSSVPVPGPPGQKGDRGTVGAQGAKGEKGQTGKSGAKYVRWGRTTCPSGAEIVYKGTSSYQLIIGFSRDFFIIKNNKN